MKSDTVKDDSPKKQARPFNEFDQSPSLYADCAIEKDEQSKMWFPLHGIMS